MKRLLISICASALVALPAAAKAETKYPSDTVHIIVPFAAGGTTDILARLVAEHLHKTFGQPFIIDNVVGAGSITGIAQLARAKPNGLTIGVGSTSGLSINPVLKPASVPYKPAKDLMPIAQFTRVPNALVVNPQTIKARTMPELVAYLKANPGKVSYGSSGVGTSQHLAAEWMKQSTGTQMEHIPYPGSSRMLTDLLGGQIDLAIDNIPLLLPQVQAGKLVLIATATKERTKQTPNVPTMAETIPGFEAVAWHGFLAPAGTPKDIVAKLNAAVQDFLKKPETIKRWEELGAEAVSGTPEQFAKLIENETKVWQGVITKGNIKAE